MKKYLQKRKEARKASQETQNRQAVIEELFYDFNRSRVQIYKMNFVRGIFFGFGSALGGTVVVALLIWLVSLLANVIPGLGDIPQTISDALQNAARGE